MVFHIDYIEGLSTRTYKEGECFDIKTMHEIKPELVVISDLGVSDDYAEAFPVVQKEQARLIDCDYDLTGSIL